MSDMNFDQMVESQETAAPARRGIELRKRPTVLVGGMPTVSLLPRELKAAARDRSLRRGLVAGVVVALVVAGGTTAGAVALGAAAQSRLDASNQRSQALVSQLAKFKDVQILEQGIALGTAAKQVGSSAELDWQAQINAIEAQMPSGYSVTAITADSASPILAYPQGLTPLEVPRVATLNMTVTTKTITDLPTWLRLIRSIPAYGDATAIVSSTDATGYTIQLTVHLSSKALLNQKAAK